MRVPAALRLLACLALVAGAAWLVTTRVADHDDGGSGPPPTVVAIDTTPTTPPAPSPTTQAGAAPSPTTPTQAQPTPPEPTPTPTTTSSTTPTLPTPPPEPLVPPATPLPLTPPVRTPAPLTDPVGQRCFGAAAADPEAPCTNARLLGTVYPTPADARAAQQSDGCRRAFDRDLLRICFWGATARDATRTIAIVGDSHASHWRAAMGPIVAQKGWRVISMSRAACPLTLARPDLPGLERKVKCMEWNRQVQAYVAEHPSITAVFTGAHRGAVIPRPGQGMRAAQRNGYVQAWDRLLTGAVRHIVVFRDTPRIAGATLRCIDLALRERTPAGEACALPRRYALRPDPLVQAAQRLPGPVQVADLSRFFCGVTVCRPVIGGALVLRDVSHMTTTFSASLGPYLRQAVDRLTATWTGGRRPGT